jgi:hypothetical protein
MLVAMEIDPATHTLRFDSAEQLDAFHRELTLMLRELMVALSTSVPDANQARAGAEQVLKQFHTAAEVLNTIRRQRAPNRGA